MAQNKRLEKYRKELLYMDDYFWTTLSRMIVISDKNFEVNRTAFNEYVFERAKLEVKLQELRYKCYQEVVTNFKGEIEIIEKYRMDIQDVQDEIRMIKEIYELNRERGDSIET